MAMSFPSRDQSDDAGSSRQAVRPRNADVEAMLMKVVIALAFFFVGSMIFGLL